MIKKFKTLLSGMLVGSLLTISIPSVAESIEVAFNKVKIQVNGQDVKADNVLIGGRTYVPLRAIGEMLGKDIGWDGNTSTAIISDKVVTVENAVYITSTGEKYHTKNCRTLTNDIQKITREDADQKGYQPCKICNP